MTEPDDPQSRWLPWPPWPIKGYITTLPPVTVRLEPPLADGRPVARVRMVPDAAQANGAGALHGGAALCFIDVSLFAAGRQFGLGDALGSVTLDLATQFVSAGRVGEPLDAVVDCVRETGRLMFLRGLLVQGAGDEHIVASFSGAVRKAPRAR